MNLVGKEFIRARTDERGVLLLSKFAGAARSLDDALPINPFDPHGTADAIAAALVMPEGEQRSRMRKLRRAVANADAHCWAAAMLADAAEVRKDQTMMPWRTAYNTTSAVCEGSISASSWRGGSLPLRGSDRAPVATSLLDRPSANSCRTSFSRSVSR